ncbi:RING finger domain-containing protein [Endozoicomonas sp.]|uniref:RING finger domain-containing protein n=1 Tax=Endozoicomonas sp. TaxID=1892382 RepID=UPI003AF9B7BA
MLSVYKLHYGGQELIRVEKPDSDKNECPVCIGEFLDRKLIETDCNHLFHASCLKTWLNTKVEGGIVNNCPLCRRNIYTLRAALNRLQLDDVEDQLAVACIDKAKQALEEYLNGNKDTSLDFIRINIQIALDNGLESEAEPLVIRCKLEMAKEALENYLNGNKDTSLDFIRINLQIALDNGLEAEAKPMMIRCRLEMAKEALENYLNGNKDTSLDFIRINLQIASDNGLEAEARPFLERLSKLLG